MLRKLSLSAPMPAGICFPGNSHIPYSVGITQADLQAVPFSQTLLRFKPAPHSHISLCFFFLSVLFVCLFAFVPSLKLPSISILAHKRLPLDTSLMDEILPRVTSNYPRPPGIPAGFLCCPSSLGMVWKLPETGHYGCVKICPCMRCPVR